MKNRWLINALAVLVLVTGLFAGWINAPAGLAAPAESNPGDAADKIEPALLDKFNTEGLADFIVRFTEQADLSPAYEMGKLERREFVYQTLKETAQRTQASAKGVLDAMGLRYETYIAGNDLYVWSGTLEAATALANRSEVSYIRATRTYYIDPVQVENPLANITWAGDLLARNVMARAGYAPGEYAWGIIATNANTFWATFGVQGEGIKVANIDTGVQWNHPALVNAFACPGDPTNAACWRDPSNICGAGGACDNNGHGTHTMGTMVADDDPTLTWMAGMAPNAQWIACKGCESSSCSDTALNTCADWILAPGGNSANAPDIVNNSWGGGGGDPWYLAKVNAWRAAGIFPAFSAGNSGPTCGSLGSPGDYQESFGSGGFDVAWNSYTNSSRGPSTYGHDPYTKPNIAAPAVSVCSTIPTNSWSCGYTGTSMASPHSAGAVALLWSCNPTLLGDIDATFQALQNTAGTPPAGNCGAPPDGEGNYTFGYGYLDVLQAGIMNCVVTDLGYVDGHVYDLASGIPLEGANVSADPALESLGADAVTDPNGYYTMTLAVGFYDVTASKYGYADQTASGIEVITDSVTIQDFNLSYLGGWVAGTDSPFDWYRYDCTWFDDGTGPSAYNEKVYCMGGRDSATTEVPDIWTYDPVADSWADTGFEVYEDVSNYDAVVLNDENYATLGPAIYIIGGTDRDTAGVMVDLVQRFYPRTGLAEAVPDDPWPGKVSTYVTTPGACLSALDDSKIFCFGGWHNNIGTLPYNTDTTYVYDPAQPAGSRWSDVSSPLSVPRAYIQAAYLDGYLYAMGGDQYDGADLAPTTVVERLDAANPSAGWVTLAPMPVASGEGRGYALGVPSRQPTDGKLYVVGGGDWSTNTAEAMEYDVASDTWNQAFPNLIEARRNAAGVYIPLCTSDPTDGMPGMWAFGGWLSADAPPFAGTEYYPIEDLCDGDIAVDAPPLEQTLYENETGMLQFSISNVGGGEIAWGLVEFPASLAVKASSPFMPAGSIPAAQTTNPGLSESSPAVEGVVTRNEPVPEGVVLWDQPLSVVNQNVYANQDFEAIYDQYDIFIADDFVNNEFWLIDKIFVPGNTWNPGGDLTCANMLNFQIYADDGGMPAGDPWTGGAYWSLSVAPTDTQVTLSTGTGGYLTDVMLDLSVSGSIVPLPEGTWWLVFYPELSFDSCFQSGRQSADTTNGNAAMVINPGGGFGFPIDWTSVQVTQTWGLVQQDFSFRLEGYPDIPWISEAPVTGTLASGESQIIDVTFDATGMAPGEYTANLGVMSNDPDEWFITLPATMTVLEITEGVLLTPTVDMQYGDPGSTVAYTLTLVNEANYTDTIVVDASALWDVTLPLTTFVLGPLESAGVAVEVTVPPDAMGLDSDLATITATSQRDTGVSAVSELTTIANTLYAIELTPAIDAKSGDPGEVVPYTLTLTNLSNSTEPILLTYIAIWGVTLSDTSFELASGESVEVVIQVTIPVDATDGASDLAVITATMVNEISVNAESELTTSAIVVFEGYWIYLPFTHK